MRSTLKKLSVLLAVLLLAAGLAGCAQETQQPEAPAVEIAEPAAETPAEETPAEAAPAEAAPSNP